MSDGSGDVPSSAPRLTLQTRDRRRATNTKRLSHGSGSFAASTDSGREHAFGHYASASVDSQNQQPNSRRSTLGHHDSAQPVHSHKAMQAQMRTSSRRLSGRVSAGLNSNHSVASAASSANLDSFHPDKANYDEMTIEEDEAQQLTDTDTVTEDEAYTPRSPLQEAPSPTGTDPASFVDPATLKLAAPKGKKLSEKGKLKLAEKRAHLMLQQYYMERQMYTDVQAMAPLSPLYDEDGGVVDVQTPPTPAVGDEVWKEPGLNEEERYELLLQYNLSIIQSDEARRRVQRHQRKLNELRNAAKTNTKIRDFNWVEEEQRFLDKYTNAPLYDENAPIVISEPCRVISILLESGLQGQRHLLHTLADEAVQRLLAQEDIRLLRASLDAAFNGRRSPLNFRIEMLWRFASTIQDIHLPSVDSQMLLQLAIYSYHLILEKIQPEDNVWHYSALCNSLELAEIELSRLTGRNDMHGVNKDYIFHAPDLSTVTFVFQKSKALLAREAEKRRKDQEAKERRARMASNPLAMAAEDGAEEDQRQRNRQRQASMAR